MNIGDKVIITNDLGINNSNFSFRKGTIKDIYNEEEDYSYHGSPWYPEVTVIELENGDILEDRFYHRHSIYTKEQYRRMCNNCIESLNSKLEIVNSNLNKIDEMFL